MRKYAVNKYSLMLALMLGLGACGGSGESNEVTTPDVPEASNPEPPAPPQPAPPPSTPPPSTGSGPSIGPLFPNSIVSTDIDFITNSDPSDYIDSEYLGQLDREFIYRGGDVFRDPEAYVYRMNFSNSKSVEVWLTSDFGSRERANIYHEALAERLGKSPAFMRDKLNHVLIHDRNDTAFAESLGKFFVLTSQNMDIRIANNDLEETIFHELGHVALDLEYRDDPLWLAAQAEEPFITQHAKNVPRIEDISETAIFVMTMKHHPERLDDEVKNWINTNIPRKSDFLYVLF